MPTLKELMGDKTRGDGRKFARTNWPENEWFEPIFLSAISCWYGMKHDGAADLFPDDGSDKWHEWNPPKQTKKVKLYAPVRSIFDSYVVDNMLYTSKQKSKFKDPYKTIFGWQEMEVEVTE